MEIVCAACSTKLVVPDERLPKGVPVVTGTCPKCQTSIEIRIPQPPEAAAPAAEPPAQAPAAGQSPAGMAAEEHASPTAQPPAPEAVAPAAEPAPQAQPLDDDAANALVGAAAPPAEEDFSEGRKLAMACFDQADQQAQVKAELEGAGYVVHIPAKAEDAVHWLQRSKYEVLVIHEEFGGSPEKNLVLKTVQPMAMLLRRHMCVGLVGKELKTLNNMTAFAKSVNFVIAERELSKIKAITRQAVADNDQFYRVYREAMRDAGKA